MATDGARRTRPGVRVRRVRRARRVRRLALVAGLIATALGLSACAAEAPSGSDLDQAAESQPPAADEALPELGRAPGAASTGTAAAPAGTAGAPDGTAAPAPVPRKLVRTVHLTLTVTDGAKTADRVEALVEEAGGYVSSSEAVRRPDELLSVRMTLRVPIERLEEVVAAVRDLGESVERQSLSTEDVTDRYVDLQARLRALRATEEELTALLRESRARGHSAEDIMAIFRELTGIRAQIEQIQGQLQQLADRTTYSTIHLELRPAEAARPLVAEGWQPRATLRSSVRALVAALQWLADAAIVLIVAVLPVLLLTGLWLWVLSWLAGRLRARRTAAAQPTEPPPGNEPPATGAPPAG